MDHRKQTDGQTFEIIEQQRKQNPLPLIKWSIATSNGNVEILTPYCNINSENNVIYQCYVSMGCCSTWAQYPHPDHNKKGSDPRTVRKSWDPSPNIDPNHTLYSRQQSLWLHNLCLQVLPVLLILLMLRIWHSSSRHKI